MRSATGIEALLLHGSPRDQRRSPRGPDDAGVRCGGRIAAPRRWPPSSPRTRRRPGARRRRATRSRPGDLGELADAPRQAYSGTGPAAALGADTAPVLREVLGLDDADVTRLRSAGIIAGPPAT